MRRGWHCEKRLPLKWSGFRERSNFPWIWFRNLRIRIWGLGIKHLKAHSFVWQWCVFSFIIISQLWWPTELKFPQVYYCMHMSRYSKWEDWSLTIILPILSSVLNNGIQINHIAVAVVVVVVFVLFIIIFFHFKLYRQYKHSFIISGITNTTQNCTDASCGLK